MFDYLPSTRTVLAAFGDWQRYCFPNMFEHFFDPPGDDFEATMVARARCVGVGVGCERRYAALQRLYTFVERCVWKPNVSTTKNKIFFIEELHPNRVRTRDARSAIEYFALSERVCNRRTCKLKHWHGWSGPWREVASLVSRYKFSRLGAEK